MFLFKHLSLGINDRGILPQLPFTSYFLSLFELKDIK